MLQHNIDMSFLLSDDLGDAVRRRLREVGGLALIALTGAAVAALATWSVRDPSFSHATSAPVHNLLGLTGAVTADLMMQLIGLASIALIAPIATWGLRLLTHGLLCREPLRPRPLIIGTVPPPGLLGAPRTVGWPADLNQRGRRDLVLRAPAAVFSPIDGSRMVTATVVSCSALAAIAIAAFDAAHRPVHRAHRRRRQATPAPELSDRLAGARIAERRRNWRDCCPGAAPQIHAPLLASQSSASATDDGDAGLVDEPMVEDDLAKAARSPAASTARRAAPQWLRSAATNLLAAYDPMIARRRASRLPGERERPKRARFRRTRPDYQCTTGPVVTLFGLNRRRGSVVAGHWTAARSMSGSARRCGPEPQRHRNQLPNSTREKGYLRELLSADDYANSAAKLPPVAARPSAAGGDRRSRSHAALADRRHGGSGKSVRSTR